MQAVIEAAERVLDQRKWSRVQLAREVGCSADTIYRLLDGRVRNVSFQIALEIFRLAEESIDSRFQLPTAVGPGGAGEIPPITAESIHNLHRLAIILNRINEIFTNAGLLHDKSSDVTLSPEKRSSESSVSARRAARGKIGVGDLDALSDAERALAEMDADTGDGEIDDEERGSA